MDKTIEIDAARYRRGMALLVTAELALNDINVTGGEKIRETLIMAENMLFVEPSSEKVS